MITLEAGKVNNSVVDLAKGLLWELLFHTLTLVNITEAQLGRAKNPKDFGTNRINTMII